MVSRVQLSATTSRPLVLRQDPDADLSRYTTTGKGKTHGGMTTGDSHMGFKTASTVCPIKSQLIQIRFSRTPSGMRFHTPSERGGRSFKASGPPLLYRSYQR